MSETALLPYMLRREPFGGLLFDPADGTMLELDHDGYAVAQQVLKGWGWFFDADKRAFAKKLKQSISYDRIRPARILDRAPWESFTETPTLSAPTLVDFQITSQCNMGCPHCYASAVRNGTHTSWEDIQLVVRQLEDCGVCQVAIGGGEPLLHPNIIDMLAMCHDCGVVPNLTTGGNEFTDANLAAIKRYCGAVGLSLEGVGERYDEWRHFGFDNYRASLARMKDLGIPTVIQVTVSSANFHELDEIVDFCLENKHLYGVIFLAYKEVGRGVKAARNLGTLDADMVSLGLKKAFDRISPHMRVGYDCCMTPGIAGVEEASNFALATNLEGCSATRGSVGISTELEVIPCTFTGQFGLGNLKEKHLREVWEGIESERFRNRIHQKSVTNSSCSSCSKQGACMGGCPVMPLINCHRDHLGADERSAELVGAG